MKSLFSAVLPTRFWIYWSAFAVSNGGVAVSAVALPLLAVTTLGATPVQIALISAATLVPTILTQYVAGVWADAHPWRARTMVAVDAGSFVLTAAIPALWLTGLLDVATLIALTAVHAFLRVWHSALSPVVMVDMVPGPALVEAQGTINGTRSATDIAGQGLGGVLVSVVGPPLAVLADAVSYLASAVLLSRALPRRALDGPAEPGPAPETAAPRAARLRTLTGWLLARAPVRVLLAVSLVGGVTEVVFVYFAVHTLGLTPTAIGAALAGGAVGGVAGGFSAGRVARRAARWTVVLVLVVTAWGLLPLAWAGPGVGGFLAALNFEAAGALAGTIALATTFGTVQAEAAAGTVASAVALLSTSLQVVALAGMGLGGALGGFPRQLFAGGGLLLAALGGVAAVYALRAPAPSPPDPSPLDDRHPEDSRVH